MGSDARDEQVIRTDQDNALIYADPLPGQEGRAAAYFKALAKEVTRALDAFGFTLCPGEVMATHPDWCRPLGQWLAALDNWVGSTDPDAVRKLTILLDFKAIFGDKRLAATLQARVFRNFEQHGSASHFLVRDDQLFAPPKTGSTGFEPKGKRDAQGVSTSKPRPLPISSTEPDCLQSTTVSESRPPSGGWPGSGMRGC